MSTRHASITVEEAGGSGLRTLLGNCLMEVPDPTAPEPLGLSMTAADSMREVERVHAATTNHDTVDYVVSPRFILSCSEGLSRDAAAYATQHCLRIHTHASEHLQEVELVRELAGQDYILALQARGLLTDRTSLAHCVHTSPAERAALESVGASVLHCPSANLKLGSGVAPIAEYVQRGIPVSLGADGAPCNNRLSMYDWTSDKPSVSTITCRIRPSCVCG